MTHRIVSTDGKTDDVLAEAEAWDRLDDPDIVRASAASEADVLDIASGADALVVDAGTPVTDRVLADLDLSVVGRAGIGVDNIDLAAAERAGVTVVNHPTYCVEEVSTHALALLLAVARKLRPYDGAVRDGGWDWQRGRPLRRLEGSTLGLVAFGAIARRLAEKVRGFDLEVVAADPYVEAGTMAEYGVERVGFDGLFERSRLVSVHAPLTDETRGLVDADALGRLPDDAVLVNTGRGGVVDEGALRDALADGSLAGAGLDVLADEPPEGVPFEHENVVLTPHAGWYSEESRREVIGDVAADVVRVLRGEEPAAPVEPGWA